MIVFRVIVILSQKKISMLSKTSQLFYIKHKVNVRVNLTYRTNSTKQSFIINSKYTTSHFNFTPYKNTTLKLEQQHEKPKKYDNHTYGTKQRWKLKVCFWVAKRSKFQHESPNELATTIFRHRCKSTKISRLYWLC